jgi:hypothetical protein
MGWPAAMTYAASGWEVVASVRLADNRTERPRYRRSRPLTITAGVAIRTRGNGPIYVATPPGPLGTTSARGFRIARREPRRPHCGSRKSLADLHWKASQEFLADGGTKPIAFFLNFSCAATLLRNYCQINHLQIPTIVWSLSAERVRAVRVTTK